MKLYMGIVENNQDPQKVGKVKLRIPYLHGVPGSSSFTSTELLPWFEPCIPWYGGYHSGSFIIPPMGSFVWCIIEEVESGQPYRVYLGGCYGTGSKFPKDFNGSEVPAGQLETPDEALSGYPSTSIIYKHTTGSIIYINQSGVITIDNGSSRIVMNGGTMDIQAADTINMTAGSTININAGTVNIN